MATVKRKRVSKKTKRSWRKNTDVVDVEEHLEEERRESRTGGVVAEKKDYALFFVDKIVTEAAETSKNNRRRHRASASDSSDEEAFVSHKTMRKNLSKQTTPRQPSPAHVQSSCWIEEGVSDQEPKDSGESYLTDLFPKPVKKPKTLVANDTAIRAVEICDQGASYNPEYEDHQALLAKANAIEVEQVNSRERLEERMPTLTTEQASQLPSWVDEMGEGLASANSQEGAERLPAATNPVDAVPLASRTRPVKAEDRKTRQQRKTATEQKTEARTRQQEKLIKQRMQDVYRLRSIGKEITEGTAKTDAKMKRKAKKLILAKTKPKRLGRHKYQDAPIALQLSEELSGSLRELKPEGDLFEERFKSLQKRNIIEPRKPVVPHRKYKRRQFDNKSYKEPTIQEFKHKHK